MWHESIKINYNYNGDRQLIWQATWWHIYIHSTFNLLCTQVRGSLPLSIVGAVLALLVLLHVLLWLGDNTVPLHPNVPEIKLWNYDKMKISILNVRSLKRSSFFLLKYFAKREKITVLHYNIFSVVPSATLTNN